MQGRSTDHKNINLAQLHRAVIQGKSQGKIIWQPRILCWLEDKLFSGERLPEPFEGMTSPEIYKELGCSNRIYEYNGCFRRIDDPSITRYERKISERETEHVVETPIGKLTQISLSNTSNYGTFPKKWWITCEEDMRVAMWIEERCDWAWDEAYYQRIYNQWGDLGLPTMFMPRVNVQHLYIDTMGVEGAIYAIYDYPQTVDKYFAALDENHERLITIINQSPLEPINFGDNLHGGTLPPNLFKKYVLPAYQKRNEKLHSAGKFTYSHWDGDTKPLLPYAKECGLDGIEAITPVPQGDVTIEEVKEALGDQMYLIDGIAAILFDDIYPESALIEQTHKIIELFAPKLILGISDEISSTGNIDRIRLVGKIVDDYNASQACQNKMDVKR